MQIYALTDICLTSAIENPLLLLLQAFTTHRRKVLCVPRVELHWQHGCWKERVRPCHTFFSLVCQKMTLYLHITSVTGWLPSHHHYSLKFLKKKKKKTLKFWSAWAVLWITCQHSMLTIGCTKGQQSRPDTTLVSASNMLMINISCA